MLTFVENSEMRSVTSRICGKMCSATKRESCDSASSAPSARRMLNAMAVTGTSDKAV